LKPISKSKIFARNCQNNLYPVIYSLDGHTQLTSKIVTLLEISLIIRFLQRMSLPPT